MTNAPRDGNKKRKKKKSKQKSQKSQFRKRKNTYKRLPESGPLDYEKAVNYILNKYYGILRHAGLQHFEAEERLSDTAFKFLLGYEKDLIRLSRSAYLNAIVTREIASFFRKKTTLQATMEVELDPEIPVEQLGGTCWQENPFAVKEILALLTPRQQEIARFLLEGYTQNEIAEEIDLKPSTVSYHVKKLRKHAALNYFLHIPKSLTSTHKKSKKEVDSSHPHIQQKEDK